MATFTDEELEIAQDVIEAAIRENFSNISVRKGTVMKELIAAGSSMGYAVVVQQLNDFAATQSLKSVEENPTAADDSVVDAILSNLFITRKEGSRARGTVKVLTTSDRSRGIPQGTEFTTGNNLLFLTETDLIAEVEVTSANSLPIFEEAATGNFFFLVPVVAEEVGDQYSIPQDTQVENTTLGSDIVLTTAFADFSEGAPAETTPEVIERARTAITVRDLVTERGIKTQLADQFAVIEDIAVIGYGDFEMKRDQFGGFGLGAGGKVNIYARTSREPQSVVLTKTIDAGSLTVDLETVGVDIPFYRVSSVVLADNPGIALDFTLTRTTAESSNNELLNTQEFARFTIYERATLTFSDASLAGKAALLTLVIPAEIDDIQRFVLDNDNRVVAADLLAYGIIPCFVSLSFSFVRDEFATSIDLDAVKNSLTSYINSLPPGTTLSISKLIDLIHDFDVIRVKIPSIVLSGELEKPDGTVEILTTDDSLDIPEEFFQQLSQNNTAYFVTAGDIIITEVSE
jgi:hypothetical protein